MGAAQQIQLIVSVVLDALPACVTGVFARPDDLSYRRFIAHVVVRSLFRRDRKRTLMSNAPSTISTYRACAEKNGFVEDIIPLGSGAAGLWMSTPRPLTDAGNILIYFHGGAYVGPARMAHFEVLLDRIKEHQHSSNQSVSDLAVLVVYNPMTQVHFASKEVHAEMVLARVLKKRPAEAEKFFKAWLDECVG